MQITWATNNFDCPSSQITRRRNEMDFNDSRDEGVFNVKIVLLWIRNFRPSRREIRKSSMHTRHCLVVSFHSDADCARHTFPADMAQPTVPSQLLNLKILSLVDVAIAVLCFIFQVIPKRKLTDSFKFYMF